MKQVALTPEELIEQIKGKKLKISPIIEIETKEGVKRVLCDCSGCNNPNIMLDIFHDEKYGQLGKERLSEGKVKGYVLLKPDK